MSGSPGGPFTVRAGGPRLPVPEGDVDVFVDAIARIVDSGRYDVVFGADDVEVLALSVHREASG